MSREQRVIFITILVILVATVLWLPWTLRFPGGSTEPVYAWAFAPPTRGYPHPWSEQKAPIQSRSLDWVRLGEEWAIVLTCGGVSTGARRRGRG